MSARRISARIAVPLGAAVNAEVLYVDQIAVNKTEACGRRLDHLQAPDLLFVCDLGTKPRDGDFGVSQTKEDNWGYLHYKPGVPFVPAMAGVSGTHRYTACYGKQTEELKDLLRPCDEKYRACNSCARAAQVCYEQSPHYEVQQFYSTSCDPQTNKMRTSSLFSGRPKKQESAALVTFVLDELNAPGSRTKNKKKSGNYNKSGKDEAAPKPKVKPPTSTESKNSGSSPQQTHKSEDESWWDSMFDEVGGLNTLAKKETKSEVQREVQVEKANTGDAKEPASKMTSKHPDQDAGKSWWSSYLAEQRGEKTLIPVPVPKGKAKPKKTAKNLNAAAMKAHGAGKEQKEGWFSSIFDEEADKSKKRPEMLKKPPVNHAAAAPPPKKDAKKIAAPHGKLEDDKSWWSGLMAETEPQPLKMKAAKDDAKLGRVSTTAAKPGPAETKKAAAEKENRPWWSGIMDEEKSKPKSASKATPVPLKKKDLLLSENKPSGRGKQEAEALKAAKNVAKQAKSWWSGIMDELPAKPHADEDKKTPAGPAMKIKPIKKKPEAGRKGADKTGGSWWSSLMDAEKAPAVPKQDMLLTKTTADAETKDHKPGVAASTIKKATSAPAGAKAEEQKPWWSGILAEEPAKLKKTKQAAQKLAAGRVAEKKEPGVSEDPEAPAVEKKTEKSWWSSVLEEEKKSKSSVLKKQPKAPAPLQEKAKTAAAARKSATPTASTSAAGKKGGDAPWYSGIFAETRAAEATKPVLSQPVEEGKKPKVHPPTAVANGKSTKPAGGAAAAEKKHETTGAWYSGIFAQEPEKAANPTANKPKLVKTEEKKAASTKKNKKDDKVEEVPKKKDISSPWSWSGIFAAADQAGAGAAPTSKTKHVKPVTAWWWPGFLS
ncbi:unnamed protein product [Amoebophrya sp. A120]|nr:unnamed protein product [Amoebophrya sp. A120]|eukprot:GSA120T00025814001.1